MKKKMLFMAAIAGLISLGSCVKDDVSSSVEAVRNAKAQELLGKAANENAQAAKANAEAALKNATQSAEVAIKQAEAALKQAEAEAAQLTTQLQKERYAAELEAAVTGFEATTADNKRAAQVALNALQDALNEASVKNLDYINSLIARYNTAFANFTKAQQAVVSAQSNLQQAKISQEYAEKAAGVYIQTQLNTIAEKTALLEALKEIEETGKTQAEVNAETTKLGIELVNEISKFDENSQAVQDFVAASKTLAAKYKAYNSFVANPTAIEDVWNSTVNKSATAINPATNAPYGGDAEIDDDDFDHTFFGAIGKLNQLVNPRSNVAYTNSTSTPVAAGASGNFPIATAPATIWPADYVVTDGDPTVIYAPTNPGFAGYAGFAYYASVTVEDANPTTDYNPAAGGLPILAVNLNNGKAMDAQSMLRINKYRVNERTMMEADKYFENYPKTAKAALDGGQENLDLAIDLLGNSSDAATTKTKMSKNGGALTLYAQLAKAKAEASNASSKASDELKALNAAIDDLATAFKIADADALKNTAIDSAKKKIIAAMKNLYGDFDYSTVPFTTWGITSFPIALPAEGPTPITSLTGTPTGTQVLDAFIFGNNTSTFNQASATADKAEDIKKKIYGTTDGKVKKVSESTVDLSLATQPKAAITGSLVVKISGTGATASEIKKQEVPNRKNDGYQRSAEKASYAVTKQEVLIDGNKTASTPGNYFIADAGTAAAFGAAYDAAYAASSLAPGAARQDEALEGAKKVIMGESVGQIANIASLKDNLATLQANYDEADAKVQEYKALVAAVDFAKYDEIVKDLEDAVEAFNTALAGVAVEVAPLAEIEDNMNALATVNVQDVANQIVAAEASIADAQEKLANAKYDGAGYKPGAGKQPSVMVWDPTAYAASAPTDPTTGAPIYGDYVNVNAGVGHMSWDEVVEFYEAELVEATSNLVTATAELVLAQKALENVDIEIDLDGDDEPAEEPETPEEPAEDPAEGGEETPAEGEGEAEGGEEA